MKHTEIFKEAKRLHALGFAIIWLHPKSKRPIESKWTTGERASWKYLAETYIDGLNVGVRTGTPSKIGDKYLACIDVDVKDPAYRAEAVTKLKELMTGVNFAAEVRSGSGNGSRHIYCLTTEPFKMITIAKNENWEICVYSDGRQMVLPPSVHPNGPIYTWKTYLYDDANLPVMDFKKFEGAKDVRKEKKPGSAANTGAEALTDFEVIEVDLGWLDISNRIRDGILHGEGVEDRSGYLLPAASALVNAGLSRNEILSVLTDKETYLGKCAYDHAKTTERGRAASWVWKYTLRRVMAERSAQGVFANEPITEPRRLSEAEAEEQDKEFKKEKHWTADLVKTDKKKTAHSLKNIDLILSNGVGGIVFQKDLFANRIIYGENTPWGGKKNVPIEDIDQILVKRWLSDTQFKIEPSTNAILEATSLIAHRKAIHPVRDWIEGLKWDGVKRVDTWLKDFCNADAPEPYLSEVSRKFLLAMVKRVFEPGCQWDYVLVLEGTQGKYKSSVARAIAGSKWFMDNLPDLKDKDAMLNLQGKWLIELGELNNVRRADYSLVKAYLIRRTDTVRPHYGRLVADAPRQSVFIGTVNEGQYLKDPTGNRRFWPVRVGLCDVKGVEDTREQLFAEAYHIYKTENEVLMLGSEAAMQAINEQSERRIDDDETEMREAMIEFMASEQSANFNFKKFKSRDLFNSNPWAKWNGKNYAFQTAAQILHTLGFRPKPIEGQRFWTNEPRKIVADPPFSREGSSTDDFF